MDNDSAEGRLLRAAVADCADRLGVDVEQVRVVLAVDVTWPDASLGCPQPGRLYAQVLTPGMLVELEVDGVRYEYHARRGEEPFWCAAPQPPLSDST